jgi:hypothetical protein
VSSCSCISSIYSLSSYYYVSAVHICPHTNIHLTIYTCPQYYYMSPIYFTAYSAYITIYLACSYTSIYCQGMASALALLESEIDATEDYLQVIKCTCFTSTSVQILTLLESEIDATEDYLQVIKCTCFTSTSVQIPTREDTSS